MLRNLESRSKRKIPVTICSTGESIETPKPLKRRKCAKLKKQPSCLAASLSFYDVLRKLESYCKRKFLSDLEVIWTRNLLIWCQTRYHCATKSIDKGLQKLSNVDFGYCHVSISLRNYIWTQCFLNETILLHPLKVIIQALALAVDFVTSYLVMTTSLH